MEHTFTSPFAFGSLRSKSVFHSEALPGIPSSPSPLSCLKVSPITFAEQALLSPSPII